MSNGAPAPEGVTEKIYQITKTIKEYKIADIPQVSSRPYSPNEQVDLSSIGTKTYGDLTVEIIDSVDDYITMLKEIFDFPLIKSFLQSNPSFKVLFDGLHGGYPPNPIHSTLTS